MQEFRRWLRDRSTGAKPEAVVVLTLLGALIWLILKFLG